MKIAAWAKGRADYGKMDGVKYRKMLEDLLGDVSNLKLDRG